MSISTAFFAFVAVVALADLNGPGHQGGGLAALTGWFLFCRWLGPRGWRWLLAAALVLSIAVAALAVVQIVVLGGRACGPFASPNFLGAYAVLMFFLAVADRVAPERQVPRLVFAAATLLTLALSQSRGAFLALGAGMLVMVVARRDASVLQKRPPHRKQLTIFAIIAAIVLAMLLIRPDTTNGRLSLWHLGWQIARMRLALGYGQGGVTISGLDHFYLIPLDVLIWAGIPAVATGAGVLYAAMRAAARNQRSDLHAFLAAWVVQGLFLSGIPATWLPLVAVLGYLSGRDLHAVDEQMLDIDASRALAPARGGADDEAAAEDVGVAGAVDAKPPSIRLI